MHMPVLRQSESGEPNPLTRLTLPLLRTRRSVKWRVYPADVLPMWVAEMDVPLAEPIRQALLEAIERGDTGYAHPGEVAEAFCEFAERRFAWKAEPGDCAVFPDVVRGIAAVIEQITEPGDGVVINPPVYHPFFSTIAHAGRRVVASPLVVDETGRWVIDFDRLESDLARPEVTAYLVCNPHNPTGTVFSRDDLVTIAELASRHQVRVLVDEIHAPLVYDGTPFVPFLSLSDSAEAAASGFSFTSATKAWNLAGLVTGLAAAGPAAVAELERIPHAARAGTGLFGVLASEAAFRHGGPWLEALLSGLEANRAMLGDLLQEHLPGIGYRRPEATYLAWLDCRSLITEDDPSRRFLRRGRVALNAGTMFGEQGKGHVRLNFATTPELLVEGVERMRRALEPG